MYGSYAQESGQQAKSDTPGQTGERAFLTYIDFAQLHEAQCKGADSPGTQNSDYELWSPNDGRHGESKCFLGQTTTYVRRKKDAKCFNGEDHEPVVQRSPCVCTELDFECDFGYHQVEGLGG